jgi:hypothetical protein
MRFPATGRSADSDEMRGIAAAEAALWANGFDASKLADYQAAHRRLEDLIAAGDVDHRHKFVIVIPVADRPQHIATCLDSLLALCRAYGYGGMRDGHWRKLLVVIADDSADATCIASNRALAERMSRLGLVTHHFGPDQQTALLDSLDDAERAGLAPMIGATTSTYRGHKGQGAMRNLAYLHLARQQGAEPDERLLFWSIDSDQEFSVKVGTPSGDVDACAVSFLHRLDEIFDQTDALVLTGKVVGDPPVSPAVMTGNFLADVIGFLELTAAGDPRSACRHHAHHEQSGHREGEAAYHDMADRFGFRKADAPYRYPCPLPGRHTEADGFAHFAGRLNGFFHGEHPTRVSRYAHDDLWRTVRPARTVYAGNYVFRPEGLKYAIPFAALRLRMSGPTLGRLVKSSIGPRFVSANLPMLHKRTVAGTGQSEFRPGIAGGAGGEAHIDMCGEFERQFFGDVMLFSIERLTADGFPPRSDAAADHVGTLEAVRDELLEQYNARRVDILAKVERLRALLDDGTAWWNAAAHTTATADFRNFIDNVARNFGDDSLCRERINSAENWRRWRTDLAAAIQRYPDNARAWSAAIERHARRT